jgi:hypothetical protein
MPGRHPPLAYSGASGRLLLLGPDRRDAAAAGVFPVLAGFAARSPGPSVPLEKFFQIFPQNIKISLGNREKSGYNRME